MTRPNCLYGANVTAVAGFAPPNIVPNSHFASYLDTSDEWIVSRTGIRERRFLEKGATSDMALEVARRLLSARGLEPGDVDLIVVATTTPDMIFPNTACIVQDKLGATRAWGFDLLGACSGFVYALTVVSGMVKSGACKTALVIGADKMSSILDFQDRSTCVLFGDAAGGFLVEASDDPTYGIIDHHNFCDGSGGKYLYMPAGGSARPATAETVAERMHYVHQEGSCVYKAAVNGLVDACEALLARNKLAVNDVAFIAPHQANMRIIHSAMARVGVPMERVMVNIERFGNTTAATIPTCIAEYHQNDRLRRGDNVVLLSFGAGFTCGGLLIRWGEPATPRERFV